ncbi:MAG: hypothetical protein M1816_001871 [Peltula sp. TS41687]|nr:MAG: hypothetical protein M1816_001871 [Peltula sp. TS41687]
MKPVEEKRPPSCAVRNVSHKKRKDSVGITPAARLCPSTQGRDTITPRVIKDIQTLLREAVPSSSTNLRAPQLLGATFEFRLVNLFMEDLPILSLSRVIPLATPRIPSSSTSIHRPGYVGGKRREDLITHREEQLEDDDEKRRTRLAEFELILDSASAVDMQSFWSFQGSRYEPSTLSGAKLEPWQVTGLAWMMKQEVNPFHGGLLADDAEMGKTMSVCALIQVASHSRTNRAPYKPTLVVCPSAIIANWIEELTRNWPLLEPTIPIPRHRCRLPFVGVPANQDRGLRIPPDQVSPRFKHIFDHGDIRASRSVVIASYEMFVHGAFETAVCNGDDTSPTPRALFAGLLRRVVCDEGHKIKNPTPPTGRVGPTVDSLTTQSLPNT